MQKAHGLLRSKSIDKLKCASPGLLLFIFIPLLVFCFSHFLWVSTQTSKICAASRILQNTQCDIKAQKDGEKKLYGICVFIDGILCALSPLAIYSGILIINSIHPDIHPLFIKKYTRTSNTLLRIYWKLKFPG